MNLVLPEFGLIIYMTIAFAILLWLLTKFAWKPIMNMLQEREESIENALHSAEKAREEMKQLQADNEKVMREAREERDAMLREARKVRETLIDEAKAKAAIEAEHIIQSAKENIQYEKMAAITDLKNQVAQLAIEIAEKVLRDELSNAEKQKEIINKQLDQVNFN